MDNGDFGTYRVTPIINSPSTGTESEAGNGKDVESIGHIGAVNLPLNPGNL